MKTVIVYSSATGNTARLAQELSAQLNLPAMPLAEAEGWQDADRILAGFWTDKGSCDEKMAAFLSGLGGKEIALFGTAGFGKVQKCCWKTSMLSWTVRTIRIWKH